MERRLSLASSIIFTKSIPILQFQHWRGVLHAIESLYDSLPSTIICENETRSRKSQNKQTTIDESCNVNLRISSLQVYLSLAVLHLWRSSCKMKTTRIHGFQVNVYGFLLSFPCTCWQPRHWLANTHIQLLEYECQLTCILDVLEREWLRLFIYNLISVLDIFCDFLLVTWFVLKMFSFSDSHKLP